MPGCWAIIYEIKLVIWKLELVLATTRLHPDRGQHNMGTLAGKYAQESQCNAISSIWIARIIWIFEFAKSETVFLKLYSRQKKQKVWSRAASRGADQQTFFLINIWLWFFYSFMHTIILHYTQYYFNTPLSCLLSSHRTFYEKENYFPHISFSRPCCVLCVGVWVWVVFL